MPKKNVNVKMKEDDVRSLHYISSRIGSKNNSEAIRIAVRLTRALVDDKVTVRDVFNEDILKLTGIDQSPLSELTMLTAMKRPERLREAYTNDR